jgi:protein-tyrosine phosphatase
MKKGPFSMTRSVLFLCTGNYYRSRFAEVLFNALAAEAGLSWRADSRGLAIELGMHNVGPLSRSAAEGLARLGIPVERYLRMPRQVAEEDLRLADLIVAVKEAEHRPLLHERHPGWVERVEYWHVHDLDCLTAAEALPVLERQVRALVERLTRQEGTQPASEVA